MRSAEGTADYITLRLPAARGLPVAASASSSKFRAHMPVVFLHEKGWRQRSDMNDSELFRQLK